MLSFQIVRQLIFNIFSKNFKILFTCDTLSTFFQHHRFHKKMLVIPGDVAISQLYKYIITDLLGFYDLS